MSAAWACDGPNCGQFVRVEDDDEWMEVTRGPVHIGHFCSQRCLRDWDYDCLKWG